MKERISLTLERDLIKAIDEKVDGSKIKNRSHAIEIFLKKYLESNVPGKAVVLAGGEGTRMKPLTNNMPKALLPFQGRTVVEHIFDLFKKYKIKEVILSVGYMGGKIKKHFGSGEKLGINITYLKEDKPLGTAGPLRLGAKLLNKSFIVVNGDNLFNIDLAEMFRHHKANKALITIALTTVNNPKGYGIAKMSGNRITKFTEKPIKAESNLINSGLYIMEPEIIRLIPKGQVSLEKEIFPKVVEKGKLFGYHFSGQWADTGTLERYENAEKEWRSIGQ